MRQLMREGSRHAVKRRPSRASTTVRAGLLLLVSALPSACGTSPEPRPQDGPPAPAAVRDGLGPDIDSQSVVTSLFANWDPFVDPEG